MTCIAGVSVTALRSSRRTKFKLAGPPARIRLNIFRAEQVQRYLLMMSTFEPSLVKISFGDQKLLAIQFPPNAADVHVHVVNVTTGVN
jgi:hypothetical protein